MPKQTHARCPQGWHLAKEELLDARHSERVQVQLCSGCTKCLWFLIVPSVSIDRFSTDLANCIATSTNDRNCVSLLRLSCAKLVQPLTSHCRVLNRQGCCIGTAGHPVSPISVNQPELVARHLLLEQILKGLGWAEPGRHMKNMATEHD